MDTQDFVTFKSYHDKSILEETSNILTKENIEFIIDDSSLAYDPSMSNNETIKDYRLKIKSQDFQRTNEILEKLDEYELEKIPKDYYLMNFSDDELYNVIRKRDEWGTFDVMLAKKNIKEQRKRNFRTRRNKVENTKN